MKRFGVLIGIGAVLALAVFVISKKSDDQVASEEVASQVHPLGTTTAAIIEEEQKIIPAGYKKYIHATYGFSILYPEALAQKEIDEGGNASTIIFQNPAEGKGFQIFVVPYKGEQVSEEQFRRDIPSGVRQNTEEVIVSGAKGAAFYSKDALLGDTREVWFIKNGYLYEVTTLKLLEADLLEVLSTWEFI